MTMDCSLLAIQMPLSSPGLVLALSHINKILPILTYGGELYPELSEQQRRLAVEIQ